MTTRVINGDCLVEMRKLADEGVRVDAVICDPPYHLTAVSRGSSPRQNDTATPFGRTRLGERGFMGRTWDGGDIAFQPETWALAAALMKPGAHLVAFGGSRTFHRVACAIEDAGLEIRDTLFWLYGSGFPKSLNVQQAINKAARGCPQGTSDPLSPNHGKFKGGCSDENTDGRGFGAGAGHFMREQGVARGGDEGPWQGWGTALKPAHEPIILARKPLDGTVAANVLAHGTGALNIDGCRVETSEALGRFNNAKPAEHCVNDSAPAAKHLGRMQQTAALIDNSRGLGRWPANILHDGSPEVLEAFARFVKDARPAIVSPLPDAAGILRECEKLFMPSNVRTVERNSPCSTQDVRSALTHAVMRASLGATTLSDCQGLGETETVRNSITLCSSVITTIQNIVKSARQEQPLDGHSPFASHVKFATQITPTGTMKITTNHWRLDGSAAPVICSITLTKTPNGAPSADANNPARFFPALGYTEDELRFHYSSKASREDRAGSAHPTVKPLSLMRWLCRLVTPPGGLILDPFAGSGTTLQAASEEGFRAIGIERELEYYNDIQRRLKSLEETRTPLFSSLSSDELPSGLAPTPHDTYDTKQQDLLAYCHD